MPIPHSTVLVALDHSENALEAARQAAALAQAMGTGLVLLHVFEGHPEELLELEQMPERFEGVVHLSDEEIAKAAERGSRKLFARIRQALPDFAGPVEEVWLTGQPADALLAYCRAHPDSLLVVGRRGQSRLRSLLLGSVSEALVRQADCPVLVISPS
ncbi:universal stress protein [Gammaproteobacteria bacterium AB-CW1]|uniref:Universal stress protein n=1 Tax=Natronospira elongata TaxID=3110268 RepID=A0AAP6JE86_9GAMM|nr:universal stress protein [Gammaproteobacteria bacterium AB-CW1]